MPSSKQTKVSVRRHEMSETVIVAVEPSSTKVRSVGRQLLFVGAVILGILLSISCTICILNGSLSLEASEFSRSDIHLSSETFQKLQAGYAHHLKMTSENETKTVERRFLEKGDSSGDHRAFVMEHLNSMSADELGQLRRKIMMPSNMRSDGIPKHR